MIAHIVIGSIGLIISIIILVLSMKYSSYDITFATGLISMVCIFVSFIILIWAPLTYLGYEEFEVKYEIQQEMLREYQENLPEVVSNMVYVADLMEINQELAGYQASKQYWDWWSCLPDEVMDLKPIGLGG